VFFEKYFFVLMLTALMSKVLVAASVNLKCIRFKKN
jgi:hypothetical protein